MESIRASKSLFFFIGLTCLMLIDFLKLVSLSLKLVLSVDSSL